MPSSFNTQMQNKRGLGLGKVGKFAAILILVSVVYVAGYFTPTLVDNRKYAPAEEKAQIFISEILAGDYDAALEKSTAQFQDEYVDGEGLKAALGDVTTENPEYKESSELRVDDTYRYSQLVEGLPENPAGFTDGLFVVSLSNVDGTWEVSSVTVQ